LEIFRPKFEQVVKLILSDASGYVSLIAVIEMSPESFFQNDSDPDSQITLAILIDPLWRLYNWLPRGSRPGTELNWFLECLLICNISHQLEESAG
jgi:hypothetical protein